jgi:uncharacterized membrane protein
VRARTVEIRIGMIAYDVYRTLHLFAVLLLFTSLGGMFVRGMVGEQAGETARKLGAISHGVAMFLVLLGGFGMLARLGLTNGLPGWIHAKLTIWVLLGAAVMIPRRFPQLSRPMFLLAPVLGAVAAWIAYNKPF